MTEGGGAPAGIGYVWDYAQSQARAAAGWDAPERAVAETYPRRLATSESPNLASGVLTVSAIGLPHDIEISAVTLYIGHVGGTGCTHGWYAVLDSAMRIIAASEDQGTFAWPATTPVTLDMIEPVITTIGGLFYLGVSVTATGLPPNFVSTAPMLSALTTQVPYLTGTSTTGLAGMREPGTQMAPVTSPTGWAIYGIIS
jgi:hypothetical protein